MNRANLQTKNRFDNSNSFRLSIAHEALERALAPRQKITVMHAVKYSDNVRVYYMAGISQKHAKIMLPKLESFVLDGYGEETIQSDINVNYFIEDNLYQVCEAYMSAGKEIIAL